MSDMRCPCCGALVVLIAAPAPKSPAEPAPYRPALLDVQLAHTEGLSVRTGNGLAQACDDRSIPRTVGNAIGLSRRDALALRNFGLTSANEVAKWIAANGLTEYAHPSWKLPAWAGPKP